MQLIYKWKLELTDDAPAVRLRGNITNVLEAHYQGDDLVAYGVWNDEAPEVEMTFIRVLTGQALEGFAGNYFRTVQKEDGTEVHLFVMVRAADSETDETETEDAEVENENDTESEVISD